MQDSEDLKAPHVLPMWNQGWSVLDQSTFHKERLIAPISLAWLGWTDQEKNTCWQRRARDMAKVTHLSFFSSWLITLYNNKTLKGLNLHWGCDCDTINQTLEESCYVMCFKHWSTSLKVGLKYNLDTRYWIHKRWPGCCRLLCVSMWYVDLQLTRP